MDKRLKEKQFRVQVQQACNLHRLQLKHHMQINKEDLGPRFASVGHARGLRLPMQWIPSDCIKRAAKQATKRAIRATKRATRAISEPCHIAMMIAAKNDIMTTATAAMTTGRKARGPGNFVDADQITPYVADQTFMSKAKYPSYICI